MKNQEILGPLSNYINNCNYCAVACLEYDNLKITVDCIRPGLRSVCTAVADVFATSHKNVIGLVEYCAATCEVCTKEGGKHEHVHCQACAEACKAYTG